jgi:hypothetical protein
MLFKEVTGICCENHTKHKKYIVWYVFYLLNVTEDVTYSHYWALSGLVYASFIHKGVVTVRVLHMAAVLDFLEDIVTVWKIYVEIFR